MITIKNFPSYKEYYIINNIQFYNVIVLLTFTDKYKKSFCNSKTNFIYQIAVAK